MKIRFEKFEGNNALIDLNNWFKKNQGVKIINIETSLTYSEFETCYKVWFFHDDSNDLIDKFLYEKNRLG